MVGRSEGKVKEMDRGCHWPLLEPGPQAIPPGAHSHPVPERSWGGERTPRCCGESLPQAHPLLCCCPAHTGKAARSASCPCTRGRDAGPVSRGAGVGGFVRDAAGLPRGSEARSCEWDQPKTSAFLSFCRFERTLEVKGWRFALAVFLSAQSISPRLKVSVLQSACLSH